MFDVSCLFFLIRGAVCACFASFVFRVRCTCCSAVRATSMVWYSGISRTCRAMLQCNRTYDLTVHPCYHALVLWCVFLFFAWRRGAAFPSDPPFPSFASAAGDELAAEDIWCPQGDEDPLNVTYEE